MSAIRVYIWGVRDGFKPNVALFPDKERFSSGDPLLTQYAQVVVHFSVEKDAILRSCDKDFYFQLSDGVHRVFSLVISNHVDIANRLSYLVFSLVCPYDQTIVGAFMALKAVKNLYKEKNQDPYVDRNLFTKEQVESCVATASLKSANTLRVLDKTIVIYRSENLLANGFSNFVGNELYFIPENSNSSVISALANFGVSNQKKLEDLVGGAIENEKALNRFRLLLNQNKQENESEISKLYQDLFQWLTNEDIEKYRTYNNELVSARNAAILKQGHLEVKNEIEAAEAAGYNRDLTRIEDLLNKIPSLRSDPELNKKLDHWRNVYKLKKSNEDTLNRQKEYNELLDLIKTGEGRYPEDLDNYKHLLNQLDDNNTKKIIGWIKFDLDQILKHPKEDSNKKYETINGRIGSLNKELEVVKNFKRDNPYSAAQKKYGQGNKKDKKLVVFLAACALFLLAAVAWIEFFSTGEQEKNGSEQPLVENNDDKDGDGVADSVDKEINSDELWLAAPSAKGRLSEFVDPSGKIDFIEIGKKLCKTCEIVNKNDRIKLKCNTNRDSAFVFDDTLYTFTLNGWGPKFTNCATLEEFERFSEPAKQQQFRTLCGEIKFTGPANPDAVPQNCVWKGKPVDNKYLNQNGVQSGEAFYKFNCTSGAWEKREKNTQIWKKDWGNDQADRDSNIEHLLRIGGAQNSTSSKDMDLDGVEDSKDKCPQVKGLQKYNGCPDDDNDGVPNHEDECPKEKGSKANNGCPQAKETNGGSQSITKNNAGGGGKQNCYEPYFEEDRFKVSDLKSAMETDPDLKKCVCKNKNPYNLTDPKCQKVNKFRENNCK